MPGDTAEAQERADELLREYLNDGELMLIPEFDPEDDGDLEFNPPVNGELVADHWIFGLYLPKLSDHYHCAIVPRDGVDGAYCYGVN